MDGEAMQRPPEQAAGDPAAENPEAESAEARKVTENIWYCPDGAYRWAYEYDMLKNPTILFTVYKVLALAWGIVLAMILVMDLIQGVIRSWGDLWNSLKLFLVMAGIFLALGALGYLVTAAILGRKYQVLFEMTEDYVKHIQMGKQVKRAEAIGMVTLFVGLMARNFATAGAGVLAMSKSTSTSEFKNVTVLKVRRRRHTIHVNQLLDKNQVYAEDADFDFVEQFIRERCVKAKLR